MVGDKRASPLVWVLVFAVTLAAFYTLNRVVMSAQGLPLDADLSPREQREGGT